MHAPRWLKKWLGWEAMMFLALEGKVDMNNQATLALAAALAAVATGVADVAKAIAAHPATAADDSGDILAAADKLQGFAGQLETLAGEVNGTTGGAPAGTVAEPAAATTTEAAPAGDTGGALPTPEAQPEFVDPPATPEQPAS